MTIDQDLQEIKKSFVENCEIINYANLITKQSTVEQQIVDSLILNIEPRDKSTGTADLKLIICITTSSMTF